MTANQKQDSPDLPFNREIMFSNHKNVYKRSLEKRQTKLLKRIVPVGHFLKENEKILLITTGCSPVSLMEQFLGGWIVFYMKRCLLVFTNMRILHIPTTPNYSYRNSIAEVNYADCKSVRMKGKCLVLEYGDGHKEKFLYVGSREAKKLKTLLTTLAFSPDLSQHTQRVHLCPRCARKLEESKYVCPNCRLEFKNREEAHRISLVYPGGGYFYTRHFLLGICDAITETLLLILVIVSAVETLNHHEALGSFIFFLVILGIEKATTVYHANHYISEYIPKEKEITQAR